MSNGMKKIGFVLIALFMSTGLFAAAGGAMEAFYATFESMYSSQLSAFLIFGVILLAAYEYWKTKQFTFLVVGIVIILIIVAVPSISKTASGDWKANFDTYQTDLNSTTAKKW